jgi:hypothetical protein
VKWIPHNKGKLFKIEPLEHPSDGRKILKMDLRETKDEA